LKLVYCIVKLVFFYFNGFPALIEFSEMCRFQYIITRLLSVSNFSYAGIKNFGAYELIVFLNMWAVKKMRVRGVQKPKARKAAKIYVDYVIVRFKSLWCRRRRISEEICVVFFFFGPRARRERSLLAILSGPYFVGKMMKTKDRECDCGSCTRRAQIKRAFDS